jgi:hypothetical protein
MKALGRYWRQNERQKMKLILISLLISDVWIENDYADQPLNLGKQWMRCLAVAERGNNNQILSSDTFFSHQK